MIFFRNYLIQCISDDFVFWIGYIHRFTTALDRTIAKIHLHDRTRRQKCIPDQHWPQYFCTNLNSVHFRIRLQIRASFERRFSRPLPDSFVQHDQFFDHSSQISFTRTTCAKRVDLHWNFLSALVPGAYQKSSPCRPSTGISDDQWRPSDSSQDGYTYLESKRPEAKSN